MTDQNRIVMFTGYLLGETEFSFKIEDEEGALAFLPKSQIEIEREKGELNAVIVRLPLWLAQKENLEWQEAN